MAGFSANIMYATNGDFSNATSVRGLEGNGLVSDGQLWIGSTALNVGGTHINVGTLTSTGGTVAITYATPNINLEVVGGAAMTNFTVDANTAPGTNPVLPTALGNITITGAQVASGVVGTNVIRTDSLAANAFTIEIQRTTAVGVSTVAANGVAHFDSARFTVDANGFVSLNGTGVAETITGDSGGALSPTAGNWNIFGRSGSKTSGAASTLTIKSPPYADAGASTTSTLNSGSFVTAAVTLTLPASAGLEDGDLFEYVCTTASALVIQAVGAQQIRVGSLISSAAGTITSTNIGDAVCLRFRAADGFFYATSVIGVWQVA